MKGKSLGGTVTLAYKTVNRQLVIDEEKVPIIQYAFKEYAKGIPQKQIINELNARGLCNRNGNSYGASSFLNALRSKKYIGILEQKGICIENRCPALIDKDTFYKVQVLLDRNSRQGKKIKPSLNIYDQGSFSVGFVEVPYKEYPAPGKTETDGIIINVQNVENVNVPKIMKKKISSNGTL